MGGDNDTAVTSVAAIRARVKAAMKQWRALRGITQVEAAAMLGITRRTYEKYEGDAVRNVPVKTIAAFCLVADVDADYLLLGRRRRKTLPTLAREFRKISRIA